MSTHSAGFGANTTWVPAEIHTGITNIKIYTINVYDIVYEIHEFFFK
ncbi:hypothetical protein [Abyssisolibacter fermentans]|nr:hypothetical protein [Abyssisolibacter fermentans]